MIDLFAWIVLITMIVSLVAVIVWLGLLPARIATERNHIHKDAITVGSWVFLLAGGVFLCFRDSTHRHVSTCVDALVTE